MHPAPNWGSTSIDAEWSDLSWVGGCRSNPGALHANAPNRNIWIA